MPKKAFKLDKATETDETSEPTETATSGEADAIAADAPEPSEPTEKPKRRRKRRKATKAISENNKITAAIINTMFFKSFAIIGGEDALPSEDEANGLNDTLAAYLDTKPNLEIPVEFALFGAYAGFILDKLRKETVAERAKVFFAAFKAKVSNVANRVKSKFKRKER